MDLEVGLGNDTQGWFDSVEWGQVPADEWTEVGIATSELNPSGR